ncbi:MFS transporter [Streptomyces sp. NBC_01236]|uniref:MFS transporter n=1 Tax=Streptomyces sp. NBC_01236 TaxID=2903789 RepID=UPI002E13FEB8|nr:hypothetical protein OG324_22255 [Streptomyces sp. NBC_01236]
MTNVKPFTDSWGTPVRLRLLLLALGTFAVGTDGMVMAGILPLIARDLNVSITVAGQLVTVFALSYAVLAPVLATATARWPRHRALLTALGPVWSSDQEFGRSPAREGSVLIGRQSWREAISPMSNGP